MADGFLNRWSRRKLGENLEPEKKSDEQTKQELNSSLEVKEPSVDTPDALPSVTLDDVKKIDKLAPDFSAFMQPGVDPSVQQAAMKKMFTDPHFNVMDGLDIYIGDYSKPDPIPLEMLKRMVQSDMLNIFRKEPDEKTQGETKVQDLAGGSEQAEQTSPEPTLPAAQLIELTSTHPVAELEGKDSAPVVAEKKTT
ncbi:DUF3306 domain-containing protein [Polynucleobacter sp.]|uniref:DUF3306 domain-containing protein n=1 Tax=Polynucleobacter sp. TaxID=2029855 RepID=UPI0033405DCA